MKALITGGAGFIGSHLAEELLGRGQEVIALDDLSTGNKGNITHLRARPGFSFQEGNVLESSTLAPLISGADTIYHLAAAVGVKHILEHAITTLETNVRGTENVLSLANQLGTKKVVIASTSEVYGKSSKIPFQEDDDSILGSTSTARWAYACSKAMDEFLALAYNKERDLPVVILRFFNTVGPRQMGRYGMVMPRFISKALADKPITVHGDGEQRRSFTYVEDVVRAVANITEVAAAEGQVFNIGNNQDISINDLAELVRSTLDSTSEIIHVPYLEAYPSGFEDTRFRRPDISKIQRYIRYQPNTDLAAIIREIATVAEGGIATPLASEGPYVG